MESFEALLTGGHPNSLGRTIEVVDIVLSDKSKLEELYACYFCEDPVVRLRTSNAFKRVAKEKAQWVAAYLPKFIDEISHIDQASTQWTLAQLFDELDNFLSADQRVKAKLILQRNLENSTDWIVLNMTMKTLTKWAKKDANLENWLRIRLDKFSIDKRKSVSGTAKKMIALLKK